MNTSIAEKIKFLRKQKKISQSKLSILANIDYNTLRKVEIGSTKNPSFDFVCKIAIALRVDLDFFASNCQFQLISDIKIERFNPAIAYFNKINSNIK